MAFVAGCLFLKSARNWVTLKLHSALDSAPAAAACGDNPQGYQPGAATEPTLDDHPLAPRAKKSSSMPKFEIKPLDLR